MIVDCDCHNYWCFAEIPLPCLDQYHRDIFNRGEMPGPRGAFPNANRPWLHLEGFKRMDINPESEDYKSLRKETPWLRSRRGGRSSCGSAIGPWASSGCAANITPC